MNTIIFKIGRLHIARNHDANVAWRREMRSIRLRQLKYEYSYVDGFTDNITEYQQYNPKYRRK